MTVLRVVMTIKKKGILTIGAIVLGVVGVKMMSNSPKIKALKLLTNSDNCWVSENDYGSAKEDKDVIDDCMH